MRKSIRLIQRLMQEVGVQSYGAMTTIGLFHPRGGCGKSSLTIFLADFLSTLYRKRVLLVDLDPQRASSELLVGFDAVQRAIERNLTLPRLMREVFGGKADTAMVRRSFITRAAEGVVTTKRTSLQEVQVLACDDHGWWAFHEAFIKVNAAEHRKARRLLRESLALVAHEFDICLIDFPALDQGPMAKLGLHAMDRWLLPCMPNAAGVRNLNAAVDLVREVNHKESGTIMPLATVLNVCQNRSGAEFKDAYAFLKGQADKRMIPPLVPRAAQLAYRKEALDATGRKAHSRTLLEKYGGRNTEFFKELNHLAKHLLETLDLPDKEVAALSSKPTNLNAIWAMGAKAAGRLVSRRTGAAKAK